MTRRCRRTSRGRIYLSQSSLAGSCPAARLRRRRPAAWLPGAGGEDTEVEAVEPGVGDTISSLVLVRPMEVVIERVALPPVSSTLWKISNSPVNSSLILLQISELNGARIGAQFGCPLTAVVNMNNKDHQVGQSTNQPPIQDILVLALPRLFCFLLLLRGHLKPAATKRGVYTGL